MSRYQAIRRAKQAAPLAASSVVGPLVAGIVGGLAWAAGAEAWAWISPMRRRELEGQKADFLAVDTSMPFDKALVSVLQNRRKRF